MISGFSFITAVIIFNIAMLIVALLRRSTRYLVRYSTLTLVLLAVLSALRILLPLDFSFTFVINSFNALPAIKRILMIEVLPGVITLKLQTVLLLIWGGGSAFVFMQTGYLFFKNYLQRKKYRLVKNEQAWQVVQKLQLKHVEIVASPDIMIPYVTGLFRAKIHLPSVEMPSYILEQVIMHEYQHFVSRDILIKAFYLGIRCVFWWNPIVYIFQRELDRLLEIRCDAAMVKHMDERDKLAYLESLLLIMNHIEPGEAVTLANASTFIQAGQPGFMEQRFLIILHKEKKKPALIQVVASALVILLFIASFMVIIQPAGNPPDEDIEGTFTINSENAYILLTTDNVYKLYVNGEFFTDIIESTPEFEAFEGIPIIIEE